MVPGGAAALRLVLLLLVSSWFFWVVLAWQHRLTRVLVEYVLHYNTHRPHRSLDERRPFSDPAAAFPTAPRPRVLHRERVLGGPLNEYAYRPAA
jgi:hypothetical protein